MNRISVAAMGVLFMAALACNGELRPLLPGVSDAGPGVDSGVPMEQDIVTIVDLRTDRSFVSADGGKTFVLTTWLGEFRPEDIHKIFRGTDGVLYVMGASDSVSFLTHSLDNGQSWHTETGAPWRNIRYADVAMDRRGVAYAITSEEGGAWDIHRSPDRGQTWSLTTRLEDHPALNGYATLVVPDPSRVIVVGPTHTPVPRLFVSEDQGLTFAEGPSYNGTGSYQQYIHANASGAMFIATEVDGPRIVEVRRSTDFGVSWSVMARLDLPSSPTIAVNDEGAVTMATSWFGRIFRVTPDGEVTETGAFPTPDQSVTYPQIILGAP